MNRPAWLLPLAGLFLLLIAAGCFTYSIGDVTYGNGNLTVVVSGTAAPETVGVQVRVFALDDFGQTELLNTGTTALLSGNTTAVNVPLTLEPGKYKMYVYLTRGGEREAAVIRDITVGSR